MKKIMGIVVVLICAFGVFQYLNVSNSSAVDLDKLKNQFNIPYDNLSKNQTFDIVYPTKKTEEKMPVVIYVHGGSYLHGSKEEYKDANEELFVNNGYIYISANYRLSTEKTFPGALDDIKALIRYLKENADEYHIDKDEINLFGFSAGANLIMMVASTEGVEAFGDEEIRYNKQNSNVNAIIAASGFYDMQYYLSSANSLGSKRAKENIMKYFYNSEGKLDEKIIEANNMFYVKNLKNPVLVIHANDDKTVDVSESKKICNTIKLNSGNKDVKCDYSYKGGHDLRKFVNKNRGYKIIDWLNKYN